MYDIYSTSHNDLWRFSLGKEGLRKLFVIGLNPSTATKDKSDTTAAKVEGVARRKGFDGFVILNLYPVRSTDFSMLPDKVDSEAFSENLNRIEEIIALEANPVIWAAWGENIHARSYFVAAAIKLFGLLEKYGPSWQHYGPLTKSGHPRHPSRITYAWSFSKLDTLQYAQALGI